MAEHIRSLCCDCAAPVCEWLLSNGGGRKPKPMKGQKVITYDSGITRKEKLYITVVCPFFIDNRAKMLEQSEPKLIKRKEWTQKETDTLVSMRAEGATYQDIARELDRSIASVSNRFKRLQRA